MAGLLMRLLQPINFMKNSFDLGQSIKVASLVMPNNFILNTVRTKVRCYFPRPNEVKRVRRHGWKARMSTPGGRKVIMRRILKGKHVLTH